MHSDDLVPSCQEIFERTMKIYSPKTSHEFCKYFKIVAIEIANEKKRKHEIAAEEKKKRQEKKEKMKNKMKKMKQELLDMFKKLIPASPLTCLMAVISILIGIFLYYFFPIGLIFLGLFLLVAHQIFKTPDLGKASSTLNKLSEQPD